MINSKTLEALQPLFEIIKNAKGKTIGQIKDELFISDNLKFAVGIVAFDWQSVGK